jgi:hypothetical protein
MPQISNRVFVKGAFVKGALGVIAISLTLGAIPLALGRDLSTAAALSAGTTEATINRAAKTDRAARVAAPAAPTQTISLRLQGLSDTLVLVRVPLVREARNGSPARPILKSDDRKLAVACEPVVSVLTEVAKQLQPGRCVT